MRCLALATLLLISAAGALPARADSALPTVASLDIERYMGRWYEIARLPNRFQRQCVGSASADYALLASGEVEVINRCRLADGSVEQAAGRARRLGGAGSPRLQVRFAPAWLAFLPQVWGDYWVIDLDPDYQLVAVSEPRREFLWILARTPQIAPAGYAALLERLAAQGLAVERLQLTPP